MKNYYEILEVNPKASKEIIQKVYKLQIKKNHPDLYQGEEKTLADQKVKELNEAYDILSDDLAREEYDRILKDENYEINKELYETLIQENNELKRVLSDKQQIIDHFLGQYDLSEYENIQKEANTRNIVNPSPMPSQNIPHQSQSKEDMKRYYFIIFIKIFYRIFLISFVICMVYVLLNLLRKL